MLKKKILKSCAAGRCIPLLSAERRCSFAIAGAIPSVIAASLALIPDRRASGFVTSTLILVKTYTKQHLEFDLITLQSKEASITKYQYTSEQKYVC